MIKKRRPLSGTSRVRLVVEVSPDISDALNQARVDTSRPMGEIVEIALRRLFVERPQEFFARQSNHQGWTR